MSKKLLEIKAGRATTIYGPSEVVWGILNKPAAREKLQKILTDLGFTGIQFSCVEDETCGRRKPKAELDVRVFGENSIPEDVVNKWVVDMMAAATKALSPLHEEQQVAA